MLGQGTLCTKKTKKAIHICGLKHQCLTHLVVQHTLWLLEAATCALHSDSSIGFCIGALSATQLPLQP